MLSPRNTYTHTHLHTLISPTHPLPQGAKVNLWVTVNNDLSAVTPTLAAFVSDATSAVAAAAALPPSAVRTLSVDRGSVVISLRVTFPQDVPYATAAAFALRASGAVQAGEAAWLVGPGFEAAYGQVLDVRAEVALDTGEWAGGGGVGCGPPPRAGSPEGRVVRRRAIGPPWTTRSGRLGEPGVVGLGRPGYRLLVLGAHMQ
jgi:hypothetical protein